MNLFGKKKKAPAPKITDTIGELNKVSQNLDKREAHLQKLIDECTVNAKKMAKAKNKRGALYHLKKKKMYEKQLDQIFGKKANLDTQIMTLEGAASNKAVLQAMKQGAQTLKATIKEQDIDSIDDVVDEIQESTALAEEMGEALSAPIGTTVDEDELEDELAELEDELGDEELAKLEMFDMPSVPTKKTTSEEPEVKEKPKPVEKKKKKPKPVEKKKKKVEEDEDE